MEAHEKHLTADPWEEAIEQSLPEGDGPTDQELRADYLLEKLAELQAEMDHLDEFTARRSQMVQDHREGEAARIQRRMDYLNDRVRACVPYDPAVFQSTYGKKSIKLPHGTLGYRSSKETVEISDKDKVLGFAKAHGIEVKVSETVNKTPILEWVRTNGEVPDPEVCGFALVPGSDDFYVKVG